MKKTILSMSLLGAVSIASATIIHTDITDVVLGSGETLSLEIDFDQDMTTDFTIDYLDIDGAFTIGDNSTGDSFLGSAGSGFNAVSPLDKDATITSFSSFVTPGATDAVYLDFSMAAINFPTDADKYIGCKFSSNANTYYGWIRVNKVGGELTVLDYAFENTPNLSILAGETEPMAISERELEKWNNTSISPNPVVNTLHVNWPEVSELSINILDVSGKNIQVITDISSTQLNIPLEDLNEGVYYLNIQSNNYQKAIRFVKN